MAPGGFLFYFSIFIYLFIYLLVFFSRILLVLETVSAESSTKRAFWLPHRYMILHWFWKYLCGIKSTRHSGWDKLVSCTTHVISAGSRNDSVEWSFHKTFRCGMKLSQDILVWNEAFIRHSGEEWSFHKTFWCGMKLSQDILACTNLCVHVVLIRLWLKKPNWS